MTAGWNTDAVSFREHSEDMRKFRGAHTDIAMVNARRHGQSAVLEKTRPVRPGRIMRQTGGSKSSAGVADWLALVPVPGVAQYKLVPN